jgi:hypothetical protein
MCVEIVLDFHTSRLLHANETSHVDNGHGLLSTSHPRHHSILHDQKSNSSGADNINYIYDFPFIKWCDALCFKCC